MTTLRCAHVRSAHAFASSFSTAHIQSAYIPDCHPKSGTIQLSDTGPRPRYPDVDINSPKGLVEGSVQNPALSLSSLLVRTLSFSLSLMTPPLPPRHLAIQSNLPCRRANSRSLSSLLSSSPLLPCCLRISQLRALTSSTSFVTHVSPRTFNSIFNPPPLLACGSAELTGRRLERSNLRACISKYRALVVVKIPEIR